MDVLTSVLTTTNESAPGRLASGELEKLCAKVTIFGIASSTAATISGLSLLVKESVPLNRLDAGAYFFVEMPTFSSWFFRWYH